MSTLRRDEFFYHADVIKLANKIAKKTREGMNRLNLRDQELNKLLIDNRDWLDYMGILVIIKDEKTITLKWESR